jgi:HPt (histidine-containing phosphotransfer) domain-containing protein
MFNIDSFVEDAASLLEEADTALEQLSHSYEKDMLHDIQLLRTALQAGDEDGAISLAYAIEGAAGSLHWPVISKGARFLRYALENGGQITNHLQVAEVHVDTLELMFRNGMRKDSAEGHQLLTHLHSLLLKYDIYP